MPDLDVNRLLEEAKGQAKAQAEVTAVLQAALQNPMEVTTYNTCALGWAVQEDGTAILMVGLLGDRQLRFLLSREAVSQLHEVTTPSGAPSSSSSEPAAPATSSSTPLESSDDHQPENDDS